MGKDKEDKKDEAQEKKKDDDKSKKSDKKDEKKDGKKDDKSTLRKKRKKKKKKGVKLKDWTKRTWHYQPKRFQKCPFNPPSYDIIWACVRKDSSFLRKRAGRRWDVHPFNLTNKNSRFFSGLANPHPARIEFDPETSKGTLILKKSHPRYPKKTKEYIPLGRHKHNRQPLREHVKDENGKNVLDEDGRYVWKKTQVVRDENYKPILDADGKKQYIVPVRKNKQNGCRAARAIFMNLQGYHKKRRRKNGKLTITGHKRGRYYNPFLAKYAIARYHKLHRAHKVDIQMVKKTRAKIAKSKAVVDAADDE